ncbi:MAG: uroporphyrinogen-III synthase [Pseudomonadota bacterium]
MRVLVTRPQPQADEWVARLQAAGVDACALPLIHIGAPADDGAVAAAWQTLAGHALVMFVSPNAVTRFFERRPAGMAWPAGVWAGATGPGTAAALRACGVPQDCVVEPQASAGVFDSEALWTRIAAWRDWRGACVLVVRGEGGRDWLAQTLQQQGAEVHFVEAYRRLPPQLDEAQQARLQRALAEPSAHVWWFSSSEAIGYLEQLAPRARWSPACAVASHPRIAARAQAAGFGRVLQAGPALHELLRALASIQSPAP